MKIVILSDSHGKTERLYELKEAYPDAKYFLHCGDIEDNIDDERCIIVRGNNDYFYHYPEESIIEVYHYKILIIHGHQFPYYNRHKKLAEYAKEKGCNVVFYGHSHISVIDQLDDVFIVNPGSCWRSRDENGPSYAIAEIDQDSIHFTIHHF